MYQKNIFEVRKRKLKMYVTVEKLQFGTDKKERLLYLTDMTFSSTKKGKVRQTVLQIFFIACYPKMTRPTYNRYFTGVY